MATREKIKAKLAATRLRNLQARAAREKLSKRNEAILKTLKAAAPAESHKTFTADRPRTDPFPKRVACALGANSKNETRSRGNPLGPAL